MAASSYYDEPGMAQAKPQMMSENTHVEGHESQSHGLGQEMHSDTRGYPQQGYNEQSSGMYNGQQQQQNMGQQHMGNNSTYGQGAPQQMNEQSNGAYGGGQQEQQMGNSSYGQGAGQQQMGSSNYTQGAGQQQMGNSNYAQGARQQPMNGGVGQAAEADNRDTITKWLDRVEKKFGGDRFNNPENAEKNKALNANILKRIKQVGMLVMQRAPSMLMNMAR